MHTTETRKTAAKKLRDRRSAWIADHSPCNSCGSSDRLRMNYIDPRTKVSKSIWSWSSERRSSELLKCQVLCYQCHRTKTAEYLRDKFIKHGSLHRYRSGCRCVPCREAGRINARHRSQVRQQKRIQSVVSIPAA